MDALAWLTLANLVLSACALGGLAVAMNRHNETATGVFTVATVVFFLAAVVCSLLLAIGQLGVRVTTGSG